MKLRMKINFEFLYCFEVSGEKNKISTSNLWRDFFRELNKNSIMKIKHN